MVRFHQLSVLIFVLDVLLVHSIISCNKVHVLNVPLVLLVMQDHKHHVHHVLQVVLHLSLVLLHALLVLQVQYLHRQVLLRVHHATLVHLAAAQGSQNAHYVLLDLLRAHHRNPHALLVLLVSTPWVIVPVLLHVLSVI